MSKKDKNKEPAQTQPAAPAAEQEEKEAQRPEQQEAELAAALSEAEKAHSALREKEEQFLRLAAEYDNFRKRSQKEKDSAWQDARCETARAFLPVYDDLERALKQETADAAFKKGVEMTMTELKKVLEKLGIQEIPALGESFDPNLHNAVMHVEDESAGENQVVEVFQSGFRAGEKVLRFAMVKVAN